MLILGRVNPLPFNRQTPVVLQVDMLEQRSAEKERALQNEVVGSTGGGSPRHSKMTPWGWSRGWRERERDLKDFFLGGGVSCVKFWGVYLSANFMSFPFSDFIWILHMDNAMEEILHKLRYETHAGFWSAGGDVCFWWSILKNPFQHRILVLSCSYMSPFFRWTLIESSFCSLTSCVDRRSTVVVHWLCT